MLTVIDAACQTERVPDDTSAATLVGISGVRRNACVAACVNGEIRAACEQERLTRVRRVGLEPGSLPVEAVDAVLALAGSTRDSVTTYVVAEQEALVPAGLPRVILEHHQAHAATAFLTSPFEAAAAPSRSRWRARLVTRCGCSTEPVSTCS